MEQSLITSIETYKTTHDSTLFDSLITQKYKFSEFKYLLAMIPEILQREVYADIKENILSITINHCHNVKRILPEYVQLLNALFEYADKIPFIQECTQKHLLHYVPTQKQEASNLLQLHVQLAYALSDPFEKYVSISHARDIFNIVKELPSREVTYKYFEIVASFFLQSHNFSSFLNAVYRMAQIEKCGLESSLLKTMGMVCQYKKDKDYGFFCHLSILDSEEIIEFFERKNYEKNIEFTFDFKYYELINNAIQTRNMLIDQGGKGDLKVESGHELMDGLKKKKNDFSCINGIVLPMTDHIVPFLKLHNFLYEIQDESITLKENVDISIVKRAYYLKEDLRAKQKKNVKEVTVKRKMIKPKPSIEKKIEKKVVKKKQVHDYFKRKFNIFKVYFQKLKEYIFDEADIFYNARKERYDKNFYKEQNENKDLFSILDNKGVMIDELYSELEDKIQRENNNPSAQVSRRSTSIISGGDDSRGFEGSSIRKRGSRINELSIPAVTSIDNQIPTHSQREPDFSRYNYDSKNEVREDYSEQRSRGSKLGGQGELFTRETPDSADQGGPRSRGSKLSAERAPPSYDYPEHVTERFRGSKLSVNEEADGFRNRTTYATSDQNIERSRGSRFYNDPNNLEHRSNDSTEQRSEWSRGSKLSQISDNNVAGDYSRNGSADQRGFRSREGKLPAQFETGTREYRSNTLNQNRGSKLSADFDSRRTPSAYDSTVRTQGSRLSHNKEDDNQPRSFQSFRAGYTEKYSGTKPHDNYGTDVESRPKHRGSKLPSDDIKKDGGSPYDSKKKLEDKLSNLKFSRNYNGKNEDNQRNKPNACDNLLNCVPHMRINKNIGRRYSVEDYSQSIKRQRYGDECGKYEVICNQSRKLSVCGEEMWSDGVVYDDFEDDMLENHATNYRSINEKKNYKAPLSNQYNPMKNEAIDYAYNYSRKDKDLDNESSLSNALNVNISQPLQYKKRVRSNFKQNLKNKMMIIEVNKMSFYETIREISEFLFERVSESTNDISERYLAFLRVNILRCPLYPMKDDFACRAKQCFETNDKVKRSAEILSLYMKKRVISEKEFCDIFQERDINNLIEQLKTEDFREAEAITLTVKTIINKFDVLHGMIRKKCINEIIAYIQGFRSATGLVHVMDILHSFALKDLLTTDETLFIYRNCILPLVKYEILETFALDNFLIICESFFIKESNFVRAILEFVNKEYENGGTSTKIALINLIGSIVTQDIEIEMVLDAFIRISLSAFENQNYLVLEALCDLYNKEETFKVIRKHMNIILPIIFDTLFDLSKTFWYEKGKTGILVILQKFMRSDNAIFSDCLRRYNKQKTMKDMERNYDTEFADSFFNLLSVDGELTKQRRKSVLPFEYGDQVYNFRFEKKNPK